MMYHDFRSPSLCCLTLANWYSNLLGLATLWEHSGDDLGTLWDALGTLWGALGTLWGRSGDTVPFQNSLSRRLSE